MIHPIDALLAAIFMKILTYYTSYFSHYLKFPIKVCFLEIRKAALQAARVLF